MAKNQRDTLIAWLNDAYALEQNLISVLKNHVKDAKNHPNIQSRLEQHLRQTEHHAELIQECVESLGSSTSATKTAMGRMSGFFSGTSTGMAKDELVKNAISDYSMEHFEIASYKAIITAAESLGESRIAEVCRDILHDEEEMAQWLEERLSEVVNEYLAHQPVG